MTTPRVENADFLSWQKEAQPWMCIEVSENATVMMTPAIVPVESSSTLSQECRSSMELELESSPSKKTSERVSEILSEYCDTTPMFCEGEDVIADDDIILDGGVEVDSNNLNDSIVHCVSAE